MLKFIDIDVLSIAVNIILLINLQLELPNLHWNSQSLRCDGTKCLNLLSSVGTDCDSKFAFALQIEHHLITVYYRNGMNIYYWYLDTSLKYIFLLINTYKSYYVFNFSKLHLSLQLTLKDTYLLNFYYCNFVLKQISIYNIFLGYDKDYTS